MDIENQSDSRAVDLIDLFERGDLKGEVINMIALQMRETLSGAAEDLERFALHFTNAMIFAHAQGSKVVLESTARQMKLLAERRRLLIVEAAWDTFINVAQAIITTAVRVAMGVTNLLPPSPAVSITPVGDPNSVNIPWSSSDAPQSS